MVSSALNWAMVVGFLGAMIGLGLWFGRYVRDDEDFFLAGRVLERWHIAVSLLGIHAAGVWVIMAIRQATEPYDGLERLVYLASLAAAVSAAVFVPRLHQLGMTTVAQFLRGRFGWLVGTVVAIVWMCGYAVMAGCALAVMAKALGPATQARYVITVAVLGGGIGLYCLTSGLPGVVSAGAVGCAVMVLGLAAAVVPALAILSRLPDGGASAGGAVGFGDLHGFDGRELAWLLMLLLPYWCSSQLVLHRALAGRDARQACSGLLTSAALGIPVGYVVMLAWPWTLDALLDGQAGSFGGHEVAPGVLPVLVLLAMGSSLVAAAIHSIAALFVRDIYQPAIGRFGSSKQYLWIGRLGTLVATGVATAVACAWATLPVLWEPLNLLRAVQLWVGLEVTILVILGAGLLWRRASFAGVVATAMALPVSIALSVAIGPTHPVSGWIRPWILLPAAVAGMIIGSVMAEGPGDRAGPTFRRAPAVGQLRARLGLAVAVVAALLLLWAVGNRPAFWQLVSRQQGVELAVLSGLGLTTLVGLYAALPLVLPAGRQPAVVRRELEYSRLAAVLGSGWLWNGLLLLAIVLAIGAYLRQCGLAEGAA